MRDPKRTPIHPGEILREDVLPGLGMPAGTAAGHLGVTEEALREVLDGSRSITPEMALRIGKFCGNGAEPWLRMQAAFDLWHAERRMDAEIARIPTMRDAA